MEAQDGPASAIVLLRKGRLLHFVIPAGTLFLWFEAAFLVFFLASVAAMAAGILELHGFGALIIMPVVAAALYGSYWGLRRHLSQQHLEIEGSTLRWYRSFHGHKLGFVERSLEDGLPVEGAKASSRRYRVRLFAAGRPLDLLCSGPREGKWLEAYLAAAVGKEAPSSLCPGCGAPLEISVEERGQGFVNCDHCDSGFVLDDEGLVFGPLDLPQTAEKKKKPGERIDHAPGRWTVRSQPGPFMATWAAGLLPAALFITGMGAFLTWAALALNPPMGMRVYMLLSGPALLIMALAVVRIAASMVASRVELQMDDGSVSFKKRVGPWLAARPTLVPSGPGEEVEQVQGAIPIRHLTQISFERELGQTLLILRSPTRALKVRWTVDTASDRWLRASIVDALRERLVILGREVE